VFAVIILIIGFSFNGLMEWPFNEVARVPNPNAKRKIHMQMNPYLSFKGDCEAAFKNIPSPACCSSRRANQAIKNGIAVIVSTARRNCPYVIGGSKLRRKAGIAEFLLSKTAGIKMTSSRL
jgi:hypothetical protein